MLKVFNINGIEKKVTIIEYVKKLKEVFGEEDTVYIIGGIFDIPQAYFQQTMDYISQKDVVIMRDFKLLSISCGQMQNVKYYSDLALAEPEKATAVREYKEMIDRNIKGINTIMNGKFGEYAKVFSTLNIEPESKEYIKKKKIQRKLFEESKRDARVYSNSIEHLIINSIPKEVETKSMIPELYDIYAEFDFYKNQLELNQDNIYLAKMVDGDLIRLKNCKLSKFATEYSREELYKQSLVPIKLIIPGETTEKHMGVITVGQGEYVVI